MSSLLLSVSSIAFYLGSKHFPSENQWSEIGKIGSTTYTRIIAWITLFVGFGIEIMNFGLFTGILVALWTMVLYTSLYILGVSHSKYFLLIILLLSLCIAFMREYIDYAG